jgi:phage gpG-like protein
MAVIVEVRGEREVLQHLAILPAELHAQLRAAVMQVAVDVQERAREKTAGEVLKIRSGHLNDSIHHTITRDDDQAIIATVGTDVVYAAIHEYGFDGIEEVTEYVRTITQAFGHAIAPREVTVNAHARHMVMPERSFLRSSLDELAPSLRTALEAAIRAVLP